MIPLNLCICLLEGPKRFNFKENEVVVSLHVLLHSSVSGRFLLPAPVEADHLKRGVTKNCIYDLWTQSDSLWCSLSLSLSLSVNTHSNTCVDCSSSPRLINKWHWGRLAVTHPVSDNCRGEGLSLWYPHWLTVCQADCFEVWCDSAPLYLSPWSFNILSVCWSRWLLTVYESD